VLQVVVPGKGHKDVGDEQQDNGTHENGELRIKAKFKKSKWETFSKPPVLF
jgi:hypothetical protein